MKIHYALLICCLFVAAFPSTGLGERTLHTFTTPDGRTLKAVIMGYNTSSGEIQIEREDGKKLWILPTVFSEPDQEYIRQWNAADQFMSPTKFKIEANSTKDRVSEEKTEIVYEITLENKTDFPLKDLRIEYRAFILSKSHIGKQDSYRMDGGQLDFAEIAAGEKASKKTQLMILTTRSSSCCGKISQDYLKGFWTKVYGPEIEGKATLREWCHPSNASSKFHHFLEACATSNDEQELLDAVSCLWRFSPEKALELALKAYEMAQSPKTARTVGELYLFHLKPVNIPLGLEWHEKAADRNDYMACSALAKFYTTHFDHQHRNAEKGIQYGLQAVSLQPILYTGYQHLAAAYALDGQFEKAVEQQEQAIKFAKKVSNRSPNLVPDLEAKLELYRNKKT